MEEIEHTKRCQHFTQKGNRTRCTKSVSKIDPEGLFCAQHRQCISVEIKQPKVAQRAMKYETQEEEKLIDFITFRTTALCYMI
jgi:hypothetical protein